MKLQNLIHILIGIVCIGLLPGAQAVVPASPAVARAFVGYLTAIGIRTFCFTTPVPAKQRFGISMTTFTSAEPTVQLFGLAGA